MTDNAPGGAYAPLQQPDRAWSQTPTFAPSIHQHEVPLPQVQLPGFSGPSDKHERRPLSSLHVLQRVRLMDEGELRDPFIANIISEREFLAVSAHFGVEVDVARALRTGTATYAKVIADGTFVRIKQYTNYFDILEEHLPLETQDPVPVGELHCPLVDGSSSTFTCGRTDKRKIGLHIKAGGIAGGGWTRTTQFHRESQITVGPGECALLVVKLSGDYSIWKKLADPAHLEVLVNITGIGNVYDVPLEDSRDFDPLTHVCSRADGYDLLRREVESGRLRIAQEYERFGPRSRSATESKYVHRAAWTSEREYHRSWGAAFESEALGALTGGAEVVATFVHKVDVAVTCPKGHDYIGRYRSAIELPQQWAAAPIAGAGPSAPKR